MSRPLRALVLAGGGAGGEYQAGCLDVLHRAGFGFDLVVGTSVGGFNGALWCQGDADQLASVWSRVESLHRIWLSPATASEFLKHLRIALGASSVVFPAAALAGVYGRGAPPARPQAHRGYRPGSARRAHQRRRAT